MKQNFNCIPSIKSYLIRWHLYRLKKKNQHRLLGLEVAVQRRMMELMGKKNPVAKNSTYLYRRHLWGMACSTNL
jgi:hypothetical protein